MQGIGKTRAGAALPGKSSKAAGESAGPMRGRVCHYVSLNQLAA
jgi:hypothetical protein